MVLLGPPHSMKNGEVQEDAWGYEDVTASNVIYIYISKISSKIK
jgi:hypothetical protein